MKEKGSVVSAILLVLFTIGLGSCSTRVETSTTDFREDVVGTWINPEYDKYEHMPWKIAIARDLNVEAYEHLHSVSPSTWTVSVEESWTDNEGRAYYRVTCEGSTWRTWKEFHLWRISKLKNVWEMMYSTSAFPTEIDPGSLYYLIYYR